MHPNSYRDLFSCDFDAAAEELDAAREADLADSVRAVALRAVAGRCTVKVDVKVSPVGERWALVTLGGEFERSDLHAVEGALWSAGYAAAPSSTFGALSASIAA